MCGGGREIRKRRARLVCGAAAALASTLEGTKVSERDRLHSCRCDFVKSDYLVKIEQKMALFIMK